jgi:L-threonylcarbamoyladenylate synthase
VGVKFKSDDGMAERYDREDFQKAIEVLKEGGLILYPTDTVWGIGCDASNEDAVAKLLQLKNRPTGKPLIVLVDQAGKIPQYIGEMPELAWDLIEVSEKPLTIVYEGAKKLAPNAMAADGSIGIRVTRELFSQALCHRFRHPIVSTSANISGKPTPKRFFDIDEAIVSGVDYVVQYRQKEGAIYSPSGVLRLGKHGEIEIIRE